MKVSQGIQQHAQKVVIYGPEGIGKTSLAANFPDPLFIDTEGGTGHLDVKRADPAPTSWSMLMGYVAEVAADPSLCRTLVIDTADWTERMCVEHVLAAHNAKGIEDFGYGKGHVYVREEFGRLLDRLTDVVGKGVNVVVTAHAQIKKFEQPDELGTYDRWELKLNKYDAPSLKEWADMVLFCNYKTIIVQPDQKTGGHAKAAGGQRVMHTTHTPAWDAKNRCGLADELPLAYSSIAAAIPGGGVAQGGLSASAPASAPANDAIERAKAAEADLKAIIEGKPLPDEVKAAAEAKAAEKAAVDARQAELNKRENLGKLRDLMEQANVTDGMLQGYCGEQGWCPAETKLEVYPEDFCAYLVTQWQGIAEAIGVPFK